MKNDIRLKLSLTTLILLVASNWPAQAFPDYLKIYARDPQARGDLKTKCSVCHVNPQGGGARNEFGKSFQSAGMKITPALRSQFPDLFPGTSTQADPAAQSGPAGPSVIFVADSDHEAIVEIGGRRYLIDTRTKQVRELASAPAAPAPTETKVASAAEPKPEPAPKTATYIAGDLRLVNLPSAAPIAGGSLWTEFTHRFPFGRPSNVEGLFGLDAQALPSFGIIYGLTDRLHVGAYRSPGDLGRPIQLFAGARILGEELGDPFSAQARVGIEGRDNFRRNFATSFELTVARSMTRYAQIYLVPTITLGDRAFNIEASANTRGVTAYAFGIGGAFRVRPTLNLIAEANYRLNRESRYTENGNGIRRPVIGFGIQKESVSRRHAFSLTFSNGPGTTMSQRSQTRGLYFADDGLRGLTIGFNLSRRFFK